MTTWITPMDAAYLKLAAQSLQEFGNKEMAAKVRDIAERLQYVLPRSYSNDEAS